jgi:perosamine synthetase
VYQTPLHREPIFAHLSATALPVAEDVCARQICLPVHSDMTDDEAEQVVTALAKVLA